MCEWGRERAQWGAGDLEQPFPPGPTWAPLSISLDTRIGASFSVL